MYVHVCVCTCVCVCVCVCVHVCLCLHACMHCVFGVHLYQLKFIVELLLEFTVEQGAVDLLCSFLSARTRECRLWS